MLEKRTIVDQVECTRSGILQIRMRLQILDGETIFRNDYHRTVLEPGIDPDAQLAFLNTALLREGEAAVTSDEWERVRRIVAVEHTPDVINAWQEKRQKNQMPGG